MLDNNSGANGVIKTDSICLWPGQVHWLLDFHGC